MPTEPKKERCPQLTEKAEATLLPFADGIRECVNFGTHIMKWCAESKAWKDERILPVLLSFRHALELLDSVSILIRFGLADPCKILLRCLFETCMAIEYILQEDTERRSMSFLVWHIRRKIKTWMQNLSDSKEQKQICALLKKDSIAYNFKIPSINDVSQRISKLEAMLDDPLYQEAVKEYDRIRTKEKKHPKYWFNLFDGPKNTIELANHLDHPGLYEILYRSWSGPIHGTGIIDENIRFESDGCPSVIQIRWSSYAPCATSLAIGFALLLFQKMIDFHTPDKKPELEKWHSEEMHDLEDQLNRWLPIL